MATGSYSEGRTESYAWTGWVLFAAIVMFSVGCINAIMGVVALFKEEVYVIGSSGLLVTTDFTAWGWTLLIWGGIMILGALGLFSGQTWARWFAIVLVVVNLIAQFAWFPAYPLWSMITIGLNIVVLFALAVRWDEARAGLRD